MRGWSKKLQNWSLRWTNPKRGALALFFCAFADASFLPLPTPLFFIILSLLNISKAYRYALFGVLGTLIGAIVGYSIGHFAWLNSSGEFTGLAQFLFNHIPGFSEEIYYKIHTAFIKWDFGILFVSSLVPLPYKILSISSGVFDMNIFMFGIATLISQAVKFFLLAYLTIKIGPNIKSFFEYKLKPIAIITSAYVAIVIAVKKVF